MGFEGAGKDIMTRKRGGRSSIQEKEILTKLSLLLGIDGLHHSPRPTSKSLIPLLMSAKPKFCALNF
jgi:hypothetical protein